MHVHVTKTTLACFFQLRRLRRVCRLLGHDLTANLVAALVFTWLDYGNALLAGLPHSSIAPYQRVINAAVTLVNGLRSHDHVTQAAIDLHWLPAEARIQYKLCLLVHHALAGRAPAYIMDLLHTRRRHFISPSSSEVGNHRQPIRASYQTAVRWASFWVAALKVWNQVPHDVRSIDNTNTFKKKLKTIFVYKVLWYWFYLIIFLFTC